MILEFKNPLLTQFSRLVAMGVHDFAVQSEGIRVQYPLSEIDGRRTWKRLREYLNKSQIRGGPDQGGHASERRAISDRK